MFGAAGSAKLVQAAADPGDLLFQLRVVPSSSTPAVRWCGRGLSGGAPQCSGGGGVVRGLRAGVHVVTPRSVPILAARPVPIPAAHRALPSSPSTVRHVRLRGISRGISEPTPRARRRGHTRAGPAPTPLTARGTAHRRGPWHRACPWCEGRGSRRRPRLYESRAPGCGPATAILSRERRLTLASRVCGRSRRRSPVRGRRGRRRCCASRPGPGPWRTRLPWAGTCRR